MASDDKNSVLSELSRDGRSDTVYSAYGHRPADTSLSGHLGYNGERRESLTGWYLLGNGYRAFNPVLMRFHSADSWSPFGAGGLNSYMYCQGNPIRFTDPMGHMPLKLVKAATGSALEKLAANTARIAAEEAAEAAARATAVTHRGVGEIASSTSRLVQPQADAVIRNVSGTSRAPRATAYDVIDSVPLPGTSRGPTHRPVSSRVNNPDFTGSTVSSPTAAPPAVNASANLDPSAQGPMRTTGGKRRDVPRSKEPVQAAESSKTKRLTAAEERKINDQRIADIRKRDGNKQW